MTTAPEFTVNNKHIEQDAAVLHALGEIYCKAHHKEEFEAAGNKLCADCQEIVDYAFARAKACPFGHLNNCRDCSKHCYDPKMTARIKPLMAYAGPRMFFTHPAMALAYVRKRLFKRG